MEIRLTLKAPEKTFVKEEMFNRDESGRACVLRLIRGAMSRKGNKQRLSKKPAALQLRQAKPC